MLKQYNGSVNDFIHDIGVIVATDSVNDDVRHLAEVAIASFSPVFHVRAMYNFVKMTFPYMPDYEESELLQTPHVIATDYFGGRIRGLDCDCAATLLCCLLKSVGIKSRVAILDTNFDGEYDHAVCQVFSETLGNIWINADVTTPDLPFGWYLESGRTTYVGN